MEAFACWRLCDSSCRCRTLLFLQPFAPLNQPAVHQPTDQIVTAAMETQNVVAVCTGSEVIKNMLPHLMEQLELCQKSLSAYLETKRAEFPRCAWSRFDQLTMEPAVPLTAGTFVTPLAYVRR
jgi:hypothetical protein